MTHTHRARVAATVVAAMIVTTGCVARPPTEAIPPPVTSAPSGEPSPADPAGWWNPTASAGTLAERLVAPWSVVPLAGGGGLVSQRDDGLIVQVTSDGSLRTAGRVAGVVSGGESGLHGIAVLEDGDRRWLYAYHGSADDNRVVRMPLLGAADAITLGEAEVVLAGIARASTHNGGRIAFGPDGLLYITTGDAQDRNAAQDPASLNGKILRVTPEGAPAQGNPFGTAVYSLGHRNVQGIAWTDDGVMWASEFGQNALDELNRIEPGGNYGWPLHEGSAGEDGFIDPVAEWSTDVASPSGIAAVGASVFIANLRGERLWVIDTRDGERVGEPREFLVGEHGRLRDAVLAPDGSLWVLTNNTDGRGSPRPADDLLIRIDLAPAD